MQTLGFILYSSTWLLVILSLVSKVFIPGKYYNEIIKLREIDIVEAKKLSMRTEGAMLITAIVLSWIGVLFTGSWPIAIVLFGLSILPAAPLNSVIGNSIYITVKALSTIVLILILLLNIQFIHWTIHISASPETISFTIPLLVMVQ